MKIINIIAITLILLCAFNPVPILALSVAQPCSDDSIECQVQLCEFDNYVNNWQNPNPSYKDCEKLEQSLKHQGQENKKNILFIASLVLIVILVSTTVLVKKQGAKKK